MNQSVRQTLQPIRIGHSACPHDCPSTCALEVEVLDRHSIGRVRGARDNDYTAGVICAKVARYAERIHNPNRLLYPLRRKGKKSDALSGTSNWRDASAWERIGWEDADYTRWSVDALARGFAFVTPTRHAGRVCTRFAIVNPETTADDLRLIIDSMR